MFLCATVSRLQNLGYFSHCAIYTYNMSAATMNIIATSLLSKDFIVILSISDCNQINEATNAHT